MHFEKLKARLIFVNAWKAMVARHKKEQARIWANQLQYKGVFN